MKSWFAYSADSCFCVHALFVLWAPFKDNSKKVDSVAFVVLQQTQAKALLQETPPVLWVPGSILSNLKGCTQESGSATLAHLQPIGQGCQKIRFSWSTLFFFRFLNTPPPKRLATSHTTKTNFHKFLMWQETRNLGHTRTVSEKKANHSSTTPVQMVIFCSLLYSCSSLLLLSRSDDNERLESTSNVGWKPEFLWVLHSLRNLKPGLAALRLTLIQDGVVLTSETRKTKEGESFLSSLSLTKRLNTFILSNMTKSLGFCEGKKVTRQEGLFPRCLLLSSLAGLLFLRTSRGSVWK